MDWLNQVHISLERALLPTLARKFAFILLFLAFPSIMLIASFSAAQQINALHLSAADSEKLQSIMSHLQFWGWFTLFSATLLAIIQISYLRYWVTRPINLIASVFRDASSGEGDLSKDIPAITSDEVSQLARTCNVFLAKQRNIIANVQSMTVGIALEAAKSMKNIKDSAASTPSSRINSPRWCAKQAMPPRRGLIKSPIAPKRYPEQQRKICNLRDCLTPNYKMLAIKSVPLH
jgi:methyl-accepting chemotaxis protein